MNNKPMLIMMVGIPGSGKSTKALELAVQNNAIILSSDALRQELLGDVNNQDHNAEIFNELHKRMYQELKNGRNVIYDATNINSRRRINLLKSLDKYQKICYYMDVDPDICLWRDRHREKKVGIDVIYRMYRNMQVPGYFEGWDKILISEPTCYIQIDDDLRSWNNSEPLEYEDIFGPDSPLFFELCGIYELPQDNPHHTFSVSRHSYHVYLNVLEAFNRGQIPQEELKMWIWTAIFHDLGKAYTKEFKGKYATFYGHENVSAQIVLSLLRSLGESDVFALDVAQFVQLHMKLLQIRDNSALENFKRLVGETWFKRLEIFREADESAK